MGDAEGTEVYLHVYDLWQGQVPLNSIVPGIESIYHTAIVAYGIEVFYGHGIQVAAPGTTHHGSPRRKELLGRTHVPYEVFREYLSAASEEYTPESYHLFWHNCNTFSNDVSEFLVGGSIASEIVDLPARFLQTPLGQTFGPMIESMFTPAATRSLATYRTVAELAEDGGEVDQQA